MTARALRVIEFDRVLERIAARAVSEAGRRLILAARPSTDRETVVRELGRVGSTMRFIDEDPDWAMSAAPDVTGPLRHLSADGAVLEADQLHRIGLLLHASRSLLKEFERRRGRFPELATIAERLIDRKGIEDRLVRSVDAEGHVLDGASRDLKRVRDRLRGAHSKIVKRLEGYLGSIPDRFVVGDASVTVREGRYVIPIRREGKGEVGGIVHDESHTGATLFVEPPMAIELMNEVRELEREESREVHRILRSLTADLAPDREGLLGALESLTELDSLHARARSALAWRATVPEVIEDGRRGLTIVDGRHPLLVETSTSPVVPFDLHLEDGERAIVLSGPNTGGKSVLLKATGLITALTQSGVVPPVGPGTRLPVYHDFFADIGDEQSIAQSLSTYSAHLANLSEIVSRADAYSLVLIDEMGTGTDPAEGAALARAALEALVARGATTLATSHLGDLKRLDSEGSGIVNASLQFDADLMEPTYRFVKGRPGRSYGLAIARRLGFPADVIDRADGYRDSGEARMEELLASLERKEREVDQRRHELDLSEAQARKLRGDLDERERAVRDAERDADRRARDDARRLLLDARSEVEEAIAELKQAAATETALDEAAHAARRKVEQAASKQRARMRTSASSRSVVLDAGSRVRIGATGARGIVLELRAERALVEAGALRLEVPLIDLEPIPDDGEQRPKASRSGGWRGPSEQPVRMEVDLRGLRVDEMELELSRSLDQAIIDDLAELRIIHGKGTGALRQRVGQMLAEDRRVRTSRMGGPTEGGAGVTVAGFRSDA